MLKTNYHLFAVLDILLCQRILLRSLSICKSDCQLLKAIYILKIAKANFIPFLKKMLEHMVIKSFLCLYCICR